MIVMSLLSLECVLLLLAKLLLSLWKKTTIAMYDYVTVYFSFGVELESNST